MKIRNMEELKRFEEVVDQCAKTVWIVTASGEQFNLKKASERSLGLSRMLCTKEYEEPEVFTNCVEDEMLMFDFIESSRKSAA